MAKDIKVTFKKDEEDIYEYILLKGKGLYLKELVSKDMKISMNSDSLKTNPGSFNICPDNETRRLLINILENTQDIKNCITNNIKNEVKESKEISQNTDKADRIEENDKCRIISDFSIDDLL